MIFFSFSKQCNLTAALQAILKVILMLVQVLPLLKLSRRVTGVGIFCEIHRSTSTRLTTLLSGRNIVSLLILKKIKIK